MQNLIKKFRRTNKGFTLVELIIVVAILAVLSGALVPQYLKYVEDSRIAVDEAYIGSVVDAVRTVAASDPDVYGKQFTVKFNSNGYSCDIVQQNSNSNLQVAEQKLKSQLESIIPFQNRGFTSNYYKNQANQSDMAQPMISVKQTGHVSIRNTKNLDTKDFNGFDSVTKP